MGTEGGSAGGSVRLIRRIHAIHSANFTCGAPSAKAELVKNESSGPAQLPFSSLPSAHTPVVRTPPAAEMYLPLPCLLPVYHAPTYLRVSGSSPA